MTEMGSNDARRVVWALGECFFNFSSYFLILIDVSITYIGSINEIREREDSDDQNGLKRHQTRRLDPN